MLQIQRNDAKYSVRLSNANLADDGNYTCSVSNELGAITRTFTVNVVGNDATRLLCVAWLSLVPYIRCSDVTQRYDRHFVGIARYNALI